MNDTDVLLSDDISNQVRRQAANNLVDANKLFLTVEEILFAHERIRSWFDLDAFMRGDRRTVRKNNRVFLLNTLLNVNVNMYVAIIYALCDDFDPSKLVDLILFDEFKPIAIGIDRACPYIDIYYLLLNYYEFDVSNFENIPEMYKNAIQRHRAEKYFGKLTKRAVSDKVSHR